MISIDMLQLSSYYKQNDLSYCIACQCAPLICGVKISNSLIIENSELENIYHLFSHTFICINVIYTNEKKSLLLLYNNSEVEKYLNEKEVAQFMHLQGYPILNIDDVLKELSKRFKNYKEYQYEFPHELGIILGYPVCDVIGFIKYKGKNSLYTGYWKVYKDLSQCKELFLKYEDAKKLVLNHLIGGLSITDIINRYQSNHKSTIY